MTTNATTDTLIGAALSPMDTTRTVSIVIAFSLFNALAAQIAIPIGPVPITMQTFAVTLTGALLGPRLGAAALIAYLIEGASGLPFDVLPTDCTSRVFARAPVLMRTCTSTGSSPTSPGTGGNGWALTTA